ncbi:Tap42 interacting protein [Entomophthora muscae]|uniref:Tap42 interacting protein n=1 Tax=Entomophthora muscae TaxID=34485 RepID=A0ACC2UQS3_9FUNG|nr:Tap42 interacting protein [Entomophthora muscae]
MIRNVINHSADVLSENIHELEGKCLGIKFKGWAIKSTKTSISCATEIEKYTEELGIPLPEMIFSNNYLSISNEGLGFNLNFNPIDALKLVDKTSASCLKVAYSNQWLEERAHWEEVTESTEKFDWTYTTSYCGTLTPGPRCTTSTVAEQIDLELLKLKEPILFYSDNVLFEDELGDNGSAMLNVKIRVMPSGFFVLQRFSLRVDNVIYRFCDTRVYHRFGTNFLLREYSSRECPYDIVEKELNVQTTIGQTEDKSYLADMNAAYNVVCRFQSPSNVLKTTKVSW